MSRPIPLMTVQVRQERDVVVARQRARQIAGLLGCDGQDQTRIATAVSELARNAFVYAGGGRVDFLLSTGEGRDRLEVIVADRGNGIPHLEQVLSGLYRSPTGMGAGLTGSRRLMDEFDIKTGPSGTTVRIGKAVPASNRAGASAARAATRLVSALAASRPPEPIDEVRQQNRELLEALGELRKRADEQSQLNRELDDTNRGVVALHAELEERADALRKADELKTWFLSSMSHEFRTPLNSIVAISRLLLEGTDGELNSEQTHQASLIHGSAMQLLELVNDLLDLAKVKAGRIDVHVNEFSVNDLFGALRASLKPLTRGTDVALVLEDAPGIPTMLTDDTKITQILRNLVSNALKFTERGTVTVSARLLEAADGAPQSVLFSVADTGIGIRQQDLERIFSEFSQVDGPVQRKVKGTGLGLSLSRKLAELIGGRLWAHSALGEGSTFVLSVPRVFAAPGTGAERTAGVLSPLEAGLSAKGGAA